MNFVHTLLLVLIVACQTTLGFTKERPNVLFIAIDDLRTDLGGLGVAYAKSPQLDAFARSGTRL